MTNDELYRRARQAELNAVAAERATLEVAYRQVWNTDELKRDFEVIGFLAPFVVVCNRKTGKKGSLEFQDDPRYYFNWLEDAR
jgi:hypothetical protein